MNVPALDLPQPMLDQICKVLCHFPQVEKAAIFGSRSNGEARENSDVDLAIWGQDARELWLNLLRDRLEEGVSTPLKLDVVDVKNLAKKSLKETIEIEGILIYERKTAERT